MQRTIQPQNADLLQFKVPSEENAITIQVFPPRNITSHPINQTIVSYAVKASTSYLAFKF